MIIMSSKTFESIADQEAEWYGTKYAIETYSDELIAKMKQPNCVVKTKKLDLPPANALIPKNFSILAKDSAASNQPRCIKTWDGAELWYKKDDKFEKPKAQVDVKIHTGDNDFGKLREANLFV